MTWHRDKLQDVYSFGLTLWQTAMNGKVPYNSLSRSDIEFAKISDPNLIKLMRQLPSDTPPALRECIKVATKYMPSDRASLDELREMLLDLVSCESNFCFAFYCN